jgi:hypothetical protein
LRVEAIKQCSVGIQPTKVIFDEVVSLESYHSQKYPGVCAHSFRLGHTAKYIDVNMVLTLKFHFNDIVGEYNWYGHTPYGLGIRLDIAT